MTPASTFDAIKESIAPELALLHEAISHTLKSSSNPLLNTVINSYLTSKGKLIRPILVILTARLFGSVTPRVIAAASAVELLHNASLIHDDVVDESKLRRGQPTINATWDNHIAVLVGDFFEVGALRQAIATGDIRIVDSLSSLGRLLSLGELDQIYNARYRTINEDAYFKVISQKTASLFVSCIEMGAYACGISEDSPRLETMRRYAEALGLCFQIRDDIFDYFPQGDDPDVGKPTGNDLREEKFTLPLLYALNRPDAPDKDLQAGMKELAYAGGELSDEAIDALYAYARSQGGIEYAYSTMQRLHDEAQSLLDQTFGSDDPALAPFRSIFRFIIERRY
ncbi:MAG: polyprenyl synthetase family protein [Pseudoflavonifractor sp.]|nr:polyprenyl synthetase family protein [Alloprevotella sp.]MCM1116311.1 polyprenyl synthetase family protein [Pseudoflavonifractor sp.]